MNRTKIEPGVSVRHRNYSGTLEWQIAVAASQQSEWNISGCRGGSHDHSSQWRYGAGVGDWGMQIQGWFQTLPEHIRYWVQVIWLHRPSLWQQKREPLSTQIWKTNPPYSSSPLLHRNLLLKGAPVKSSFANIWDISVETIGIIKISWKSTLEVCSYKNTQETNVAAKKIKE